MTDIFEIILYVDWYVRSIFREFERVGLGGTFYEEMKSAVWVRCRAHRDLGGVNSKNKM